MLVVKIGGAAGVDREPLLDDLATRKDWVLVHGASDGATELGEKLGTPARFVTSVSGHVSRLTDPATLEAFAMASARLNLRLVEGLQRRRVNAIGLTGVGGRLLEAQRKDAIKVVEPDGRRRVLRGDFTGTVEKVNTGLLRSLLDQGYAPVIGLPALATDGNAVNADADRAAAVVAARMPADVLVILSNVPGLLRDVNDPGSLVRWVTMAEWDKAEVLAEGRFKKKMLAAREALDAGVPRVILASANKPQPLASALNGEGTVIEGRAGA